MVDMSTRVLVTDGDQRASLACVRSLAKAGMPCFVIGPRRGSLAGSSRYSCGRAAAPDPQEDREGFLAVLADRVREWGANVLLPITEKSLRAVLPVAAAFPGVRIPFPAAEVFSRVSDKSQVLEAAPRAGIDVPHQWMWRSREEAQASQIGDSEFPLVVKPIRSVARFERGVTHPAVTYLDGPNGLWEWVDCADERVYPVLVQRRVVGAGSGVFVLLWDGVLRAVVGHRRIREKPPAGGVSVVRESTVVAPEMLDRSLKLLRELGWECGVAMVEYKVDHRSGRNWLMEVNGRFWGSLQLAIDAGVDFPSLLLQCSEGNFPREVVVGKPGIRTRWLLGDLDQLLVRLARRRTSLHVSPLIPRSGEGSRGLPSRFPSSGETGGVSSLRSKALPDRTPDLGSGGGP